MGGEPSRTTGTRGLNTSASSTRVLDVQAKRPNISIDLHSDTRLGENYRFVFWYSENTQCRKQRGKS